MRKVKIDWDWPVEEGHYLVSNYFSPVAVVVSLIYDYDKIPKAIEDLVRTGVEGGAAISGTLQTANVGIEKIVLNIVSNPNIRWLILIGPKSKGHKADDALKSLVSNSVDDRGFIIGTKALTAILKNISIDAIKRFREQITLIDFIGIDDVKLLEEAVTLCYQEKPTIFSIQDKEYNLYDLGAFPESPIIQRITDKLRRGI